MEWLSGFECDEASLWDASQIRPADSSGPERDSILIFEHLYRPDEFVCINSRHVVTAKKDGVEKVTIIGPGETKTSAKWLDQINTHGTPEIRAGCWIRLNPLRKIYGSGAGGAHTDAGVAIFRYLLLESDLLEPSIALMVLAGQALDEVRRDLQRQGAQLKGSMWSLRGNMSNLSPERQEQRKNLCREYTKLGRAMSLREALQAFYTRLDRQSAEADLAWW